MVEIEEKRVPTQQEAGRFLTQKKEAGFLDKLKAWAVYFIKKRTAKEEIVRMIPYFVGFFFLGAGMISSIGQPLLNIISSELVFEEMRWFFLFIGVDLIGSFAIPLLFIKLGLLAPFSIYGLIAPHLFKCEEILLFSIPLSATSNLRLAIPCWLQTVAFLAWLFSVIILFIDRFPYVSAIFKAMTILTRGNIYSWILMVKVFALIIILITSTPFGFLTSGVFAILIVMLDMFTFSLSQRTEAY